VNDKPNVLIIWGDDIGQSNLSCYSNGLMGYRTPNIDRVAAEGVLFTDYYAEQSCTAGRAAFITGQNPYRTGLTKVGLPGAPLGLQAQDPTIATALKAQGYATGQFGKNHLGDRDEHLPTMHGFDEFFGNLYHLNAEEEPELPDYPKDPEFRKKFGPPGEPYVELRVPKLFNLRTDPYERADITSNTYYDWMVDHIFLFVPAQAYVAKMLETLIEFPQRQKSASFSMDQVLAKLQDATTRSS
jgi:arylsulfatase A-like enzyme